LLGNPSPYSLELFPYLLGNPSSVSWRKSPSTLIPGWLYTDPPPSSPFPFPLPQRFPISNACPPTTTLRYQLHTVRYNYPFANRLNGLNGLAHLCCYILSFHRKYDISPTLILPSNVHTSLYVNFMYYKKVMVGERSNTEFF
jgi:hypothetical protein